MPAKTKTCEQCNGTGGITRKDPVLFTTVVDECPSCLGEGFIGMSGPEWVEDDRRFES